MRPKLPENWIRWSWIFLLGIVMIPGCGGCQNRQTAKKNAPKTAAEKEKELLEGKKKPKDDFESKELIISPVDPEGESKLGYVKPGHWATGSIPVVANNFDFRGNLIARTMNSQAKTIETENTNYRLVLTRPATLPKGQEKDLELTYYIPRTAERRKTYSLGHELKSQGGGRVIFTKTQGAIAMPADQYFFVVLSDNRDKFKYIELLSSIRSPEEDMISAEMGVDDESEGTINRYYYRVTRPKIDKRVPLPSQALSWTSIAYIVWDDIDPTLFTPNQQRALLDWLHFGGQLIVNGPASLPKLQNSFLADYLPASAGEIKNLSADDFAEFNAKWSIPKSKKKTELRSINLTDETTVVGVDLKLKGNGQFLPDPKLESRNEYAEEGKYTKLVAENFVGRGRIVVTGFSMTARPIVNWKSWDAFINNALMRRPKRTFGQDNYAYTTKIRWDIGASNDPMQSTTLRYISRDLGSSGTPVEIKEPKESEADANSTYGGFQFPNTNTPSVAEDTPRVGISRDDWHYGGFRQSAKSGVAGWNDQSGISQAARSIITDAAGITPPSSEFVLKVLGVYLLVLVPVNWLFFRIINRLEWAWIAAPIIAIIGTVFVVRLASLDIGFARSKTQIGVLEMYGGYPRGHLTQYTAMYTSLSSKYDLEFDDGSAQAQPFAMQDVYSRDTASKPRVDVEFKRERNWSIKQFQVQSNSTEVIHSEQMHSPGGAIRLVKDSNGSWNVENESDLNIQDVGIVRLNEDNGLQRAWVGTLGPKQTVALQFEAAGSNGLFQQWSESSTTRSRKETTKSVLKKLDTDGNGAISREEAMEMPEISRVFGIVAQNSRSGDSTELDEFELNRAITITRKEDEVSLGDFFDMVSNNLTLSLGECRLMGWTDNPFEVVKVTPVAPQSINRTFVVVHLDKGKWRRPARDGNTIFDINEKDNDSRKEF